MSRLNDDLAKAFQLVNGIGAAPGVDVTARLQALQQLQAQMDRVMRGLREQQTDQLKAHGTGRACAPASIGSGATSKGDAR
ncbi:hypothetical protein DCD74_02345 [Lysobacter oculi]|uniref:Uncharacterized protein n=1 Tax=Solilutibacter oculi TaxID=2698682 RepID=A0A344J3S3_9GAMM|nr:hypothetical protein [Lysobacter oculi]AXA83683.1 hypothetical protein DCD74_02345 [Lysobacter oculi]